MKQLSRNSIHSSSKSHDCLLKEEKGKKIKFTYEAFNSGERCNVELFDGYKWNHIFGIKSNGGGF